MFLLSLLRSSAPHDRCQLHHLHPRDQRYQELQKRELNGQGTVTGKF